MSNQENDQAQNEAETSLTERCGYCGLPKRPDKLKLCTEWCQCPNASDSTAPNIRLGCVPESSFRRSPSAAPPAQPAVALTATDLKLVEIISVREKHGWFHKAIPCMPMPLAVLLCVFNVLTPGIGTLLSVFAILYGCQTEHGSKRRSTLISLLAAFLQIVTALIIVGWIWSILWGITFISVSANKDYDDEIPNSML